MTVTINILTGPTLEQDPDGWEHYAYVVELEKQALCGQESETMSEP